MDTIAGMYSVGQYVYTVKEIRGWFDFSVNGSVPANKIGRVAGYVKVGKNLDNVLYEIAFDKEYGHVNIKHSDLKLG